MAGAGLPAVSSDLDHVSLSSLRRPPLWAMCSHTNRSMEPSLREVTEPLFFCCPDKVGLSVCTKHVTQNKGQAGGGGQGKWVVEKADKTVSPPARPGGQSHVDSPAQLWSNLASSVWALRTGPANNWPHSCLLSLGKKQPFTWSIRVAVVPGQAPQWSA